MMEKNTPAENLVRQSELLAEIRANVNDRQDAENCEKIISHLASVPDVWQSLSEIAKTAGVQRSWSVRARDILLRGRYIEEKRSDDPQVKLYRLAPVVK